MSEEEVEDSIVAYTSDDERLIDPDTDGDRECVVTKWISKIKTEPSVCEPITILYEKPSPYNAFYL